jgi:hypothetical protein
MKRLFAAMTAALLMVALVAGTTMANDQHGNVGTAYGLSGVIYDAAGNSVGYTCGSVHRTVVAGGWQDKENCVLDAGAVLPTKPMTVSQTLQTHGFVDYCSFDAGYTFGYHNYDGAVYNTSIWYSDYTYTVSGGVTYETAQSWSYKITPTGSVTIVAFFPTVPITDPCY